MTDIYETMFGQKGNFATIDGRVVFMGGPGSGGGGGSGGGVQSNATEKQNLAADFWSVVLNKYGDTEGDRITATIDSLRNGRLDWFRNASNIRVVAANRARFGRFGFDQDKYDNTIEDIINIGKRYSIDVGAMQN